MIARCGLALFLSVVTATVAQAGVVVDLAPETGPPYGGPLDVAVFLRQDPVGDDHPLRSIQFDLTVTDNLGLLDLSFPAPHNGINFWDFTSLAGCLGNEAVCGDSYVIDDDLADATPGPNMLWISFVELVENTTLQINLPFDGNPVKVGVITVNVPAFDGTYLFDVLNAGEADEDLGAEIHWGFGTENDPLAELRANTGGITGGTLEICVGGDCEVRLQSSEPLCDESLWRTQKNFVLLTFDGEISAPSAGDVVIQEITAGGVAGADFSSEFLFTVEGAGNDVLRITEDGDSQLTHRKWYRIANEGGWAGVAGFERDYVVQMGDCDNNGLVVGADFSCVNTEITCFNCPDRRADIDGNNLIVGADASLVNSFIPSFPVAKPSGHACGE